MRTSKTAKLAPVAAFNSAIDQRETFCTVLDDERESLNQSRVALLSVVDELDGIRVPTGLGTDFTDALDEVAHQGTANLTDSSVAADFTRIGTIGRSRLPAAAGDVMSCARRLLS